VDAAARLLYPHMLRLSPSAVPSPQPVRFADPAAALRWLDTERPNLVAAVRQAAVADGDLRAVACLVADALRGYFHLRRFGGDWLAVARAALAAATAADDARGMAAARHSLGTAYRCLGDLRVAVEHYTEALRQARSAGWLEAEATALGNLGIVYQGQGRLAAAAGQLTRALDIDRQTGRQDGVANNLSNLATVYLDQDRLEEATDHFAEALELNRRSGTRHGQALALTGLGNAYRESGQPAAAAAMFAEAMHHCTGIGDRDGQATVHLGLAAVERALGRVAASTEHALAALTLAREGGDPRTEADALIALAATRADRQAAATEYARAYELTTVPRTQIESLIGLAGCALDAGDTDEASRHAHSALDRAHRSGFRRLAAAARELLPTAPHSPPGVPLVRADQAAFTEPEAPVDVDAVRR
jgi:tetratricopeptide (TPR) repeat protein